MNNMKKHRYLAAACLLLLSLLAVSCISDDYPVRDKATVKMTFTTRAISNLATTAGGLEANEYMHTLRVIVARQNGEILYNLKYDIAQNETSKTITFSEMTVNADGETFDFYAIANEEGVGYDGWDDVTVAELKGMNLQSKFLTNANDVSKNTMIPQTAYKQIRVAPQSGGGIQSETMKLDFAVAKVRLTINNTSAGDQYVNDINLSGLNMTSTPLFANGTLSDVTGGTLSLGNMTIHANGTATVYAYFFENTGGTYNLTASWNGTQTLNLNNSAANINAISRGTELNINITLNATTTPTFNIEVVPWAEVEVDVPPFEVPQFK